MSSLGTPVDAILLFVDMREVGWMGNKRGQCKWGRPGFLFLSFQDVIYKSWSDYLAQSEFITSFLVTREAATIKSTCGTEIQKHSGNTS